MIRLFDITLSLLAIVVLSPLMLPIMAALLLTGEHHIIYRQARVGRGGRVFNLLKFATMVSNAPNLPGGMHTLKDDPRLLPMGKFLRKTKMNELPQLINILRGDMSVIGYRPTDPSGYINWPEWAREELKTSRPGLSGIGSVAFRNEEEILHEVEDKDGYFYSTIIPYKLGLESWYQKNKSILLYWRLIFLTIDAVLGGTKWKEIKGIPEVPESLRGVI